MKKLRTLLPLIVVFGLLLTASSAFACGPLECPEGTHEECTETGSVFVCDSGHTEETNCHWVGHGRNRHKVCDEMFVCDSGHEEPVVECSCVPDGEEPVIPVTGGAPAWEWPSKPEVPMCTDLECAEFTWDEAIAPAAGTMNIIWTMGEVPNYIWSYLNPDLNDDMVVGIDGWLFNWLPVSRAYMVSPEKFEIIYAGEVIEAAPSDKVGGLYLLSAPPSGDWRITKGLTAGVFDEYSWTESMRFRNVAEGDPWVVNNLLSCRGNVLDE